MLKVRQKGNKDGEKKGGKRAIWVGVLSQFGFPKFVPKGDKQKGTWYQRKGKGTGRKKIEVGEGGGGRFLAGRLSLKSKGSPK